MSRQKRYMNKECGNVLTYTEMIEEWEEMYDGNDDTNPVGWEEYYEEICEYAIVVDYYHWDSESEKEYTKKEYLGIAYPPRNIYVFDEEHNSRSFTWNNKAEAEKYFKDHGFDKPALCYENARIEKL